jgi:hypothetical protein
MRPFSTLFIIEPGMVVSRLVRFSIATGCAAAITEVLVKARAIKEIRENFIFGEDLKNTCFVACFYS